MPQRGGQGVRAVRWNRRGPTGWWRQPGRPRRARPTRPDQPGGGTAGAEGHRDGVPRTGRGDGPGRNPGQHPLPVHSGSGPSSGRAGTRLKKYVATVRVNAVGLDWMIDFDFAHYEIQSRRPIQGNLDPLALLVGGKTLDAAADRIMETFASGPFIFNLGHGVLPDTPVAHIERLIARVRSSG